MTMTNQEFIENAPLYTRIPISSFLPPASIMRMCENSKCKRETTWFKTGDLRTIQEGARPDIDLQHVAYECGLCKANSMGVVYAGWSVSIQSQSRAKGRSGPSCKYLRASCIDGTPGNKRPIFQKCSDLQELQLWYWGDVIPSASSRRTNRQSDRRDG